MPRPKGLPRTGGRKKGTPNKSTADVRAMAKEHGAEAIARLVKLMKGAENETVQLGAARDLLDRAYGKPKQDIGVDLKVNSAEVVAAARARLLAAGDQ